MLLYFTLRSKNSDGRELENVYDHKVRTISYSGDRNLVLRNYGIVDVDLTLK
jgi:hypothetical protein